MARHACHRNVTCNVIDGSPGRFRVPRLDTTYVVANNAAAARTNLLEGYDVTLAEAGSRSAGAEARPRRAALSPCGLGGEGGQPATARRLADVRAESAEH